MAMVEGSLGYRVCTSDGDVLGRLAWLRYGLQDGRIEALMIRPASWRRLFSSHERSVPSHMIESVIPGLRHVIVGPPRPVAS
jgi:sporulation protein YlmC with PRC-barrel domain